MAVNAISEKKGITEFRPKEVNIIKAFLQSSKTNVVVADYSKFDRISYINVCGIEQLDYIISDSNVTKEQIERYTKRGVKMCTPKIGDYN